MHRTPIRLAALARGAGLVAGLLAGLASAGFAATPLTTIRVASGLTRPVFVTSPPGDDRIFIVEQRGADAKGRIKILKNGAVNAVPFLTTGTLATGNEEGLLGLAFPPDYATTRAFYIYYTDTAGNNHIARHRAQVGNPDRADSIGTNVLTLLHPTNTNHNGGWIAFGPDGYLWVGTGDGGSGGDPPNNAQNLNSFLGKILRLAVDTTGTYTSPPDNPYVGIAGLDEIWAYGMRNPFRMSFDRETHDLLIGDVGQLLWEEVDYVPFATGPARNMNFGWSCWEGDASYNPGYSTPCGTCANTGCMKFPAHVYSHSGGRCSVTGGFVYRGCAIPDLRGTYFFADYCTGQIYSGNFAADTLVNFVERTAQLDPAGTLAIGSISSFGEDKNGELYICDLPGGEVFKIVPNGAVAEADQPTIKVATAEGDSLGMTGYGNALLPGVVPFTDPGSRIAGVGYLTAATKRACEQITANGMTLALRLGNWDIDVLATVDPDSATLTRQFVFTNRGATAPLNFRDVISPTLEGDADVAVALAPESGDASALLLLNDADAPALYVTQRGIATGATQTHDMGPSNTVEAIVAADQALSGANQAGPGALALALGFSFGTVEPAASETVLVVTRLSTTQPVGVDPLPTVVAGRLLRSLGASPFRSTFGFVVNAPAGTELKALDVYDARGRRIARLASPQTMAGPMTISWDGRDAGGAKAPPGFYFVRARTSIGDETLRAVRID